MIMESEPSLGQWVYCGSPGQQRAGSRCWQLLQALQCGFVTGVALEPGNDLCWETILMAGLVQAARAQQSPGEPLGNHFCHANEGGA